MLSLYFFYEVSSAYSVSLNKDYKSCDKPDESPLEAAQRELLEETGYGNGRWTPFLTMAPNSACQNNLAFTFLAEDVEGHGRA